MSAPRKEVSLRTASPKKITRDALVQKVAQERELRSFTRCGSASASAAAAAALFIQIWRRTSVLWLQVLSRINLYGFARHKSWSHYAYLFLLSDHTCLGWQNVVPLTAVAMCLVVTFTDPKGWKNSNSENTRDADTYYCEEINRI